MLSVRYQYYLIYLTTLAIIVPVPSLLALLRSTRSRGQEEQSGSRNLTQASATTSVRRSSTSRDSTTRQLNDPQQYEDGDRRVPFYNIAHMINSIEHIGPALRDGANGIETDISFDKRGYPVETYHGFPCDCGRHCHFREDLVKFVKFLAGLTIPPAASRLLIVLFDLKLKDLDARQKEVAGYELAKMLHEEIYARFESAISHRRSPVLGGGDLYYNQQQQIYPQPLRFVISINHAADSMLVKSFIKYMQHHRLNFMSKQIGFDVGMNDDLNEISSMWNELNGTTFNLWQGDGLTNCANLVRGVDRLKQAISIRNSRGHFRKVYYWTADIMYHIRSVLRLGLDAILTNQPQRVVQVLQEPEFNGKYRLATPYDDPFAQFWIQPSAWRMSFPTIGEALETVTNIQKTGEKFVQTLPDGIAAVIKKVNNSITSSSSS